jgi:hypothetical protein
MVRPAWSQLLSDRDGGVESPALVYADLLPANVAKFVPSSIVIVHLTIIAPNKMMVTR